MIPKTTSASVVSLILLGLTTLSGCASHDHQNDYILGEATAHNQAIQSVQDMDERDERTVEGRAQ